MNTFVEFRNIAAEHGIILPPNVEEAAATPTVLGEYCYAATPMLAAVAAVGHTLRRNPGHKLANHTLPLAEIGDDTPSRTLATMINASVAPAEVTALPSFNYDTKIDTISACDWADQRLGSVARFIGKEATTQVAYAQIITHKEVPIIMRKGAPGHPSAMNIRPILLNGIPLPAGTILRVNTVHDYPPRTLAPDEQDLEEYLPPVPLRGEEFPGRLTQCDISDVTQVGFGRLSSYALSPRERTSAMFPNSDIGQMAIDYELFAHLRHTTIEEMAAVIDANMQYAVDVKTV